MGSIPFHLIGFDSEGAADAAATLVNGVIAETSEQLCLDIRGLDGVTVAHDYHAALAHLDRGFESEHVLTATKDEMAEGVAMAPIVFREGQIMSHIVLSATLLPTIAKPIGGVSGRYTIAHELAHVHEHYRRDQILPNTLLPNTLLKPYNDERDPAVLFQLAEPSWSEYAACFFSAPIYPEQAGLLETTLAAVLGGIRERIIAAKVQWVQDKDYSSVLREVANEVGDVIKYFSYLLGHARGLSKSPEDIAPQAWAILHTHDWLYPSIEKLECVLGDMFVSFERWTGMDAFDPLKDVARSLIAECGITITQQANKSLYVYVSPGKVCVTP